MFAALAIGFGLGLVGSIPVAGPISVLVLALGVEGRFRKALGSAVGGALAEALYAAFAFWGYAALLKRVPWLEPVSQVAGALVLMILGVVLLVSKSKVAEPAKPPPKGDARGGVAMGFGITALNPALIITWTTASSALLSSGVLEKHASVAIAFGVGVTIGIITWFSTLLALVKRYKAKIKPELLAKGVRLLGVLVFGFGALLALEAKQRFFP